MKQSQKLAIRSSEIRSRLNEIAALETDAVTDEIRGEAETLRGELGTVETQYRAALAGEAEEEQRAAAEFDADPETAEVRALRGRVRIGEYMASAVEGRAAAGAEGELNAALGLPANRFPLSLIAPAPEVRTTTDADAATTQSSWVDRLFSETAAMRLGVTFEGVAPGVAAFPVTASGASAAQRGRTQAAADTAWTVRVVEAKPSRNTVRAVFSEEDAHRLPAVEEALRRDLSMALAEGVDRTVFLGDTGANEDSADITGLATATGVIDKELTQAQKATATDTLQVFMELIDGKHAVSPDDLRIVMATGANAYWRSRLAVTEDATSQAAFMIDNMLRWTTRGDLADDTAANDWAAFVGRNRGINGAAVAAIWDSGAFIRDPYSSAASGKVSLTLSYYWALVLPRASNFARVKFVA